MWNIISCLILPKSLTYLFIAVIYKYHWSDSSSDSSYRKWITLKFRVTIMTVILHTAMLISCICLGTTLHVGLNGLKMNQLFGISRLILRSILILDFIDVSWWSVMLTLNTALATQSWKNTRNKSCLFSLYVTTHQKGEDEFLIYIISMLNDWREQHPM